MRIETLYAIYDEKEDEIIWNSRGSAYKNMKDVANKIQRLSKQYPDRTYKILEYRLDSRKDVSTPIVDKEGEQAALLGFIVSAVLSGLLLYVFM